MYQELEGVLNNYFDGDYKLSLIPFDEVHLQEVENMPIFELNEMDDGEYVLECAVYNYEKDTSLILQGNVDLTNGNVHCGSHPLYSAAINQKLTQIEREFGDKKITASQARDKVANLQKSMRLALSVPGSKPIRLS